MSSGFVHGVLNSDNINVTGESFDYGPWRFAPAYDPLFTAAYFDEVGLYAFGRQPGALGWNLARLAECLLHLTGLEAAQKTLDAFPAAIQREFRAALLRRLALAPAGEEADAALSKAFTDFLMATRAPFEQVFFDWRGGLASAGRAARSPAAALYQTPEFAAVRAAMAEHEATPDVGLDHAYFRRPSPCTMLIDEVEAIWVPIAEEDDWSALERKLAQIAEMREAYGFASS
jgi:uncharacterized protein YdiU (UPF0061 family)